ncbi:protein-tyrosine phosphatase family protein [Alienimonas californiensis]|uniref:Cytochrome C n=1 Tax=Alienimonas californiensis TaxID=2527989 RepID=A0A517PA05_9PLAN|nr:hypothetical protein [Alienimonas californiensis]QDT16207.1 hypothetical protein CA12_23070 [Alienimonas californiensis]
MRILLFAAFAVPSAFLQDSGPRSFASLPPEAPSAPVRLEADHLPNPVRVHPRVISGGLPEGEEAFRELRDLGVRTVLSVDGITPDVATACKYGLRYVHLPHGYDGIPADRVNALAKAVSELEGPIYIHCHHGKHRSPAAAATACVAAGLLPPEDAVPILTLAGTSPKYRGLYRSAERARPLGDAFLKALAVEFPEKAAIPPTAEAMIALERTQTYIKAIADAGWRAPADHPDLDPAHEALLFREQFAELLRTEETRAQPDEYRRLLRDSEQAARDLETGLRGWTTTTGSEPPPALRRAAERIAANCTACHVRFRDVPLDEQTAPGGPDR